MPSFTFTSSVAAGAIFEPLTGWQYARLPWPAEVTVLARAVAVGVVNTYTSGSETIVEESPVQSGGTAGVIPSPLNTPVQGWIAAGFDLLKLRFRNTSGAAINVDGIIEVIPM